VSKRFGRIIRVLARNALRKRAGAWRIILHQ
jgi:hypothetical protein